MKVSITRNKNKKILMNYVVSIVSILFWIGMWQVVSVLLHNEILLPSPVDVFSKLGQMILTRLFWVRIITSMSRIVGGFLLGLVIGGGMSLIAYRFRWFHVLLHPVLIVMKTTPVASFIILALIWIGSRYLAVFIAFLMVLPVIYTNMYEGLKQVDPKLLEMSKVFRMSTFRNIRYIYIPGIYPYMNAAVTIALGLCWKAGIAAEVIGIPLHSIGEELYQSKLYMDTDQVLGWTIVIIVCSFLFEKLFLYLLRVFYQFVIGVGYGKN